MSAPTGQICTVLPEKCDVNGSVGKGATSTKSPRPEKTIWASPATSAAKRVHREHWMQRSRSRSTRSEIGTGLVLEGALAALVTDRAVEGVVGEEEL